MTKEEHIQYISNIRKTLYSIENNSAKISGLKDYDWVAIRAAHRLLGESLEFFKSSIQATVLATKCGDKYQQLFVSDWNSMSDMCNGDKVRIIIIKKD